MEGGEAGRFLGRIEGIGWLLRKNRIENGSRADPSGSNPHSYGDSFSVSGAIWASQKFIVVSEIGKLRTVWSAPGVNKRGGRKVSPSRGSAASLRRGHGALCAPETTARDFAVRRSRALPIVFFSKYGKGSGEQCSGVGQPFSFLQPFPVRNHI